MEFKVKCIDDRYSSRIEKYKLKKNSIYTVTEIELSKDSNRSYFILKDNPIEYFMRRFVPVGKIIINLPEDIEHIDL